MQHRIIMLVGLILLLAACSTGAPAAEPGEPVTIAELDAKVQLSATALLERESIPIVVIYLSSEDQNEIVRYEWIDYRQGGDILAVTKPLNEEGASAVARSEGEWRSAADTPQGASLWEADPSLGENPVAVIAELEAMTTQATPIGSEDNPGTTYEALRQVASDESELWTLLISRTDGPNEAQQWIVNPDGLLQFYRLSSDPPRFGEGIGTIVVEYGVTEEDPEPVAIPELGTPLLLDELGIAEPLRVLEE